MLIQLKRFFACLLLVLLPLQSFASVHMSVCKNMPDNAVKAESAMQQGIKPCHMLTKDHKQTQRDACKSHCEILCANLASATFLSNELKIARLEASTQQINLYDKLYTSITPQNPQRPPISLS